MNLGQGKVKKYSNPIQQVLNYSPLNYEPIFIPPIASHHALLAIHAIFALLQTIYHLIYTLTITLKLQNNAALILL